MRPGHATRYTAAGAKAKQYCHSNHWQRRVFARLPSDMPGVGGGQLSVEAKVGGESRTSQLESAEPLRTPRYSSTSAKHFMGSGHTRLGTYMRDDDGPSQMLSSPAAARDRPAVDDPLATLAARMTYPPFWPVGTSSQG